MTRLREYLYLGSADDTLQVGTLKQSGITAVLNVADDVPNTKDVMYNWYGLQVPLKDNTSNNPTWLIDHAVYTLSKLLASSNRVLCHCKSGINRSPTVCALYISRTEGKTFDEAWKEIRSLRPEVYEQSKTLPTNFGY